MTKTILITGATDGIGLETAKLLAKDGHVLLLHGRSPGKLDNAKAEIASVDGAGLVETYVADLADLAAAAKLAEDVRGNHDHIGVVINNAGVLKIADPSTESGLDVRFVVNTLAPYVITKGLLPSMTATGRVVNVSSAAQAPVNFDALLGRTQLDDNSAYAQSKLAITMWTNAMAAMRTDGPLMVSVNPGSLLASKMVKEGYGIPGNDLGIGAGILTRAALSDEFSDANGKYFDNDAGQFGPPHSDALDRNKCEHLLKSIDEIVADLTA